MLTNHVATTELRRTLAGDHRRPRRGSCDPGVAHRLRYAPLRRASGRRLYLRPATTGLLILPGRLRPSREAAALLHRPPGKGGGVPRSLAPACPALRPALGCPPLRVGLGG